MDQHVLSVRLPPDLVAAADAEAALDNLSRSAWVRRELVRLLATGSVRGSMPPSPPRRRHIPPSDLAAVSRLSADLSRTGGAVVQLAKALRETAHPAHLDAESVLADVRSVRRQLSGLIATMSASLTGDGRDA